MCTVLILADERSQWHWIEGVVREFDASCTIIPEDFITLPNRRFDSDLDNWAADTLQAIGSHVPKVAVIDLYLSDRRDSPEGLWIIKKLATRFPNCAIILVTNKVALSTIPKIPVPIRASISIASTNSDRYSQLTDALGEALQPVAS